MSDRSAISFNIFFFSAFFFDDKDHFFSSTLHAIVYPIMRQAKEMYTRTHPVRHRISLRARMHFFDMPCS